MEKAHRPPGLQLPAVPPRDSRLRSAPWAPEGGASLPAGSPPAPHADPPSSGSRLQDGPAQPPGAGRAHQADPQCSQPRGRPQTAGVRTTSSSHRRAQSSEAPPALKSRHQPRPLSDCLPPPPHGRQRQHAGLASSAFVPLCSGVCVFVDDCGIVHGYVWLSNIVDGCPWFWMVVYGCGCCVQLSMVVYGCPSLWMVFLGCGWL